jgi:hypothetical protein
VITVYRAASGRPDLLARGAQASAVPGMVGAIQTFGQLIHAHPHIHALVTEGVFLPDGRFQPLSPADRPSWRLDRLGHVSSPGRKPGYRLAGLPSPARRKEIHSQPSHKRRRKSVGTGLIVRHTAG